MSMVRMAGVGWETWVPIGSETRVSVSSETRVGRISVTSVNVTWLCWDISWLGRDIGWLGWDIGWLGWDVSDLRSNLGDWFVDMGSGDNLGLIDWVDNAVSWEFWSPNVTRSHSNWLGNEAGSGEYLGRHCLLDWLGDRDNLGRKSGWASSSYSIENLGGSEARGHWLFGNWNGNGLSFETVDEETVLFLSKLPLVYELLISHLISKLVQDARVESEKLVLGVVLILLSDGCHFSKIYLTDV
jgi:hypothetical protein